MKVNRNFAPAVTFHLKTDVIERSRPLRKNIGGVWSQLVMAIKTWHWIMDVETIMKSDSFFKGKRTDFPCLIEILIWKSNVRDSHPCELQ